MFTVLLLFIKHDFAEFKAQYSFLNLSLTRQPSSWFSLFFFFYVVSETEVLSLHIKLVWTYYLVWKYCKYLYIRLNIVHIEA